MVREPSMICVGRGIPVPDSARAPFENVPTEVRLPPGGSCMLLLTQLFNHERSLAGSAVYFFSLTFLRWRGREETPRCLHNHMRGPYRSDTFRQDAPSRAAWEHRPPPTTLAHFPSQRQRCRLRALKQTQDDIVVFHYRTPTTRTGLGHITMFQRGKWEAARVGEKEK